MDFQDLRAHDPVLDVIVLSRDGGSPPVHVLEALEAQRGVNFDLHVVDGRPRADEKHRLETITRARNEGRRLGAAAYVMFLDDDVVPVPGCLAALLEALRDRPAFAALAADYLGDLGDVSRFDLPGQISLPLTDHVAMGATLFRRQAFARFSFRWEPGRCECQCCCDDLRRAGFGVAYLPSARAIHRQAGSPRNHGTGSDIRPASHSQTDSAIENPGTASPRILTAFDRSHLVRFRRQFLPTLRESGNEERVTAVAYGLRPSERRLLEEISGLEVVSVDDDGRSPSLRRLRDFQAVVASWPGDTPVAHWDAGDILFQGGLHPLWTLVRRSPDRLLAVREPAAHPENVAVAEWTLSIRDPAARTFAYELLTSRPVLNGGFAACTARSFLAYLVEADRLCQSRALLGTTDWGDQTALNLYCHSRPERWRELPESWNFTIYQRRPREYRMGSDGRFESASGEPIHVVHGNNGTLDRMLLPRLAARHG